MIRLALIGYGYWGPNLFRNFSQLKNCKVVAVSDSRKERLRIIEEQHPGTKTYEKPEQVFADKDVDAVVIATPVNSHFELAKKALEAGKHVLVEKPLTSNVDQAEELIELAEKKGLLLMVDHTYLYTSAVIRIKELIDREELGTLEYIDSTRINLGLFQPDVNVLWDLAPHDISIMLYLSKKKPSSINATGVSHTENGIENMAYLTVNFDDSFLAHFNCSWISPVKVRNMLIGGNKKMVLFNDLEPTEKIKVYDTGYNIKSDEDKARLLVDYRTGDIFIPKINTREALSLMAEDFVQCILDKKQPVSNARLGLDVVKILAAAQASIKSSGKEIKI